VGTLDDIGFYTLTNDRAKNTSWTSRMWRCEMIVTDRCNFKCLYCRGVKAEYRGDIDLVVAFDALDDWNHYGRLRNMRFSGGEPTLYRHLNTLVRRCKRRGVKRIAISTNGSADWAVYLELIKSGVNDFSISLDACCASDGDMMSGIPNAWSKIADNIRKISQLTYVTVGVVLTDSNVSQVVDIIQFAHNLGVADIRIVTAAQNTHLPLLLEDIGNTVLSAHPILKYRVANYINNRDVRGLVESDSRQCHLVKDDSVVMDKYHFPCVIYMREGGAPIGLVSDHNMRSERREWFGRHDSWEDDICRRNCLDVCMAYNNKVAGNISANGMADTESQK